MARARLSGGCLYDAKMIYEDQLAAMEVDSKRFGTTGGAFDPALLTDGLKAEREQGITIDVAYRYFSTQKRKFIIADCPGHEQYTRNMATGASTCDLAIILIDARYGVQTQTKRHSFIVSLLGIKHVLVAINKMDLVDYSQDKYEEIREQYKEFATRLDMVDQHFIPIAALHGENLIDKSEHMPWYEGTHADAPPGECAYRVRPQPHRLPLPGAVRQSAEPELPRLLRHGGVGPRRQGGRDHGAPFAKNAAG